MPLALTVINAFEYPAINSPYLSLYPFGSVAVQLLIFGTTLDGTVSASDTVFEPIAVPLELYVVHVITHVPPVEFGIWFASASGGVHDWLVVTFFAAPIVPVAFPNLYVRVWV